MYEMIEKFYFILYARTNFIVSVIFIYASPSHLNRMRNFHVCSNNTCVLVLKK